MRAYLISMGSLGDMLPFVYIGRALADRGHQVTLLGCDEYRGYVRDARIEFVPIMSAETYRANVERRKGSTGQAQPVVDFFHWACSQIEPIYRLLTEQFQPGSTVVCAQAAAIGARVAQQKHGIPLATAHLQPIWMRSAFDMPPIPPWLSRVAGRPLQALIDLFVDNTFRREVNRVCAPLGVVSGKGMIRTWWNSPECILGLFPDWYSSPQSDWPTQTVLAGFPVPGRMDPDFDSSSIEAYLKAGSPPIVFSQGSNDPNARMYFQTCVETATALGHRGVLLSPFHDLVPDPLPAGIVRFPYVPLDVLLPRAAAHVHHGGVGTIAHTLKAGIPQLTVPVAFDQPDNSHRLARLGVASVVRPRDFTVNRIVTVLRRLLESPEVASRCQEFAGRVRSADPFRICCDVLERLATREPIAPERFALPRDGRDQEVRKLGAQLTSSVGNPSSNVDSTT